MRPVANVNAPPAVPEAGGRSLALRNRLLSVRNPPVAGNLRPVANVDALLAVPVTGGQSLALRNRSLSTRNPPAAGDFVSDCQPVELQVASERRSRRLAGVQRQYVVAVLFPSLTDMEDEDDGVEFCWRDEDGGCL